jgi:hypothetical protein
MGDEKIAYRIECYIVSSQHALCFGGKIDQAAVRKKHLRRIPVVTHIISFPDQVEIAAA